MGSPLSYRSIFVTYSGMKAPVNLSRRSYSDLLSMISLSMSLVNRSRTVRSNRSRSL